MRASVTDLRRRMGDVLRALDRGEEVTLTYRGDVKGTIVPRQCGPAKRVQDDPFFGMCRNDARPVREIMKKLRRTPRGIR